jgi:hypothetical protein
MRMAQVAKKMVMPSCCDRPPTMDIGRTPRFFGEFAASDHHVYAETRRENLRAELQAIAAEDGIDVRLASRRLA